MAAAGSSRSSQSQQLSQELYDRVKNTAAYTRLREASADFWETVTEMLRNDGALYYVDEQRDGPSGPLFYEFSEETRSGLGVRVEMMFRRETPNDSVAARKLADFLESTELDHDEVDDYEDNMVVDPESFSDSSSPPDSSSPTRSTTPSSFCTPPSCTPPSSNKATTPDEQLSDSTSSN